MHQSMRRSMHQFMGLCCKKWQQLPSGSASGQPYAATTTSAYELRKEDLGRLHHAAAHGDPAWLRRWHWWLKRVGINRQDTEKWKVPMENIDGEKTEESSAGGPADKAVLSTSCPMRTANFTHAAIAQHRGGALPAGGAEQEEDAESLRDFKDWVTQLQQKLADALKKQSMSEVSLDVAMLYNRDLEEDNLCLQKELDGVEAELQELEEQRLQAERCVHDLKTALDNKEREAIASSQKLQDLLLASSGTNTTVKQLEEHVQRLEIENARLEATVQQQSNRIEALQRDLQASASMQKQNLVAWTSKDSHSTWEEQSKSRYYLEEHAAQNDREKAELLEQGDSKGQPMKKLIVGICRDEVHLCEELRINFKLQKDCERYGFFVW
ncbi:uncharacterized protein LOC142600325 isoform X1 [Balearica regulorum gibbericeps]|uniref:uncharacterized protein LOC142600325 isoform X1 n=1 Tax=Balearica regulorum gibbericeps TaxID=100784 RepID=UPI003F6385E9